MAGLHGLKGTVYENGIRVPCFARWPAGFKSPGKVTRLAAHIDVMPTILEACGVAVPAGAKLDGRSFLPLLRDPAANWPGRTLFFQWDSGQEPRRGHAWCAVTEQWKLLQPVGMDSPQQQHIRDRYAELCRLQGRGERSIEGAPRHELYDLAADPGEAKDLAAEQPTVVEKMKKQYEAWFDDVAARWLKPKPNPSP
jgi:arylsulfatase/arylsulfatase A